MTETLSPSQQDGEPPAWGAVTVNMRLLSKQSVAGKLRGLSDMLEKSTVPTSLHDGVGLMATGCTGMPQAQNLWLAKRNTSPLQP